MQTAAIRMTGVDNRSGSGPSEKSGLKIEGAAAELLGISTTTAQSTTFSFDDWAVNADTGQPLIKLSQIKVTYVLAPDVNTGVLTSYMSIVFNLTSFNYGDQVPRTTAPALTVYSENSAGGVLDSWPATVISVACNQNLTLAYTKTFDPDFYLLVETVVLNLSSSTWWPCANAETLVAETGGSGTGVGNG
jgi:hypothetical protein